MKKIPVPHNAKEHESFLKNKNKKSVKQSKITTHQSKIIIDKRRRIKTLCSDKTLISSCMIIHYIVEENTFAISLHSFIKEEILKRHIKDCFKINGKQRIIMPKKDDYLKIQRKVKSHFMIYTNFESILVPEDNE